MNPDWYDSAFDAWSREREDDEPAPDPATDYPEGAAPVCMLQMTDCGLCGKRLYPDSSTYWYDAESGLAVHPECWSSELAEAGDPYRYFGVRRSDF